LPPLDLNPRPERALGFVRHPVGLIALREGRRDAAPRDRTSRRTFFASAGGGSTVRSGSAPPPAACVTSTVSRRMARFKGWLAVTSRGV